MATTTHKVTMNLTENDMRNTKILVERLHARNKASAVSGALAIAEGLTRKIEEGGYVIAGLESRHAGIREAENDLLPIY